MPEIELKGIDVNEIDLTEEKRQAKLLPERASLLSIHNDLTLNRVNEFVKEVKRRQKDVDNKLDPIIDFARKTKKALLDLKKETKAGLIRAEEIAKAEINRYLTKLKNEKLKADRLIAEEAEKRFAAARELEKEGKPEEAEELRKEETTLAPAPKEIKLSGTHQVTRWDAEVIDESKLDRDLLMPNMVKIRKIATTYKDKASRAGVRFFPITDVVTRIKTKDEPFF